MSQLWVEVTGKVHVAFQLYKIQTRDRTV